MITTLIFDLDGLLADTEKLHRRAYQDVLAEVGASVSEAEYEEHWIRLGKGISEFIQLHNLSVDVDFIRSRKATRYRELVLSSAEPMPGALETLRTFHGHKTLALATSSYPDAADAVLNRLLIAKYFSCIAAKGEAERAKPFPDIFLRVARTLSVASNECLVVEDSEKGILAAHAARMPSVAVPNVHTVHNDFSKATVVLPSLLDLTPSLVKRLR
jgi:beta-phosphoglucomutase